MKTKHTPAIRRDIGIMERMIAYHAARSDIECYCAMEHHHGKYPGRWYVTDAVDPLWREDVDLAVRYMEARGLLLRHPKARTLVRPLDESQPSVSPRLRGKSKGGAS